MKASVNEYNGELRSRFLSFLSPLNQMQATRIQNQTCVTEFNHYEQLAYPCHQIQINNCNSQGKY